MSRSGLSGNSLHMNLAKGVAHIIQHAKTAVTRKLVSPITRMIYESLTKPNFSRNCSYVVMGKPRAAVDALRNRSNASTEHVQTIAMQAHSSKNSIPAVDLPLASTQVQRKMHQA